MIAKIEQLLKEVEALHASNAEELEALRIKYLSKKGAINDLMADFRNVAAEQKKEVGMRLNELKTKAQDKILPRRSATPCSVITMLTSCSVWSWWDTIGTIALIFPSLATDGQVKIEM